MKIRQTPEKGFTLIELLVVISIIAILAGIAVPAFTGVITRGQQTKALSDAKQIYLALKMYAGDNDGAFPSKVASDGSGGTVEFSNQAFRHIVPDYVKSEKIFYVAKSQWSTKTPDEDFGSSTTTTPSASAVAAGENHWAYVVNLSDTSNPNLPILADGFADAETAKYSAVETEQGGLWKGEAAIVIRVDGSGRVERIKASDDLEVKGPVGATGGLPDNIFTTTGDNWLAPGTTGQYVVNPQPAT